MNNKNKQKFEAVFEVEKPIIGMLHLKADSKGNTLEIAKKEIEIYKECGVDAVLVENYFGKFFDVEEVLSYLYLNKIGIKYGVNVLGSYTTAYHFADLYHADFIQIDSVAGHLTLEDDQRFSETIKRFRKYHHTLLLGGVRFKYQPVLSGNNLEKDLKLGMKRCDAIVVTGDGTGQETDLAKIKQFREVITDFPLVVGAGLNLDNCLEQLAIADAGIVGSYFKEGHDAEGDVSYEHTKTFMSRVKTLRK